MGKKKGRGYRKAMAAKTTATIVDIRDKHRVALMQDHTLQFPDLYLRVFVVGDESEQRKFAELFSRTYSKKASSIEDADIVVFTGGPDVDPQLYGGGKPHSMTHVDVERDNADINAYLKCHELGIPMIGVCRGMQFLHVMNGGKLYQHVTDHCGDHKMWCVKSKEIIEKISSVHHQAVMPCQGMEVHAYAVGVHPKERWLNADHKADVKGVDVEAMYWPETLCFGVQGHPEYAGYNYYAYWFLRKIEDLVIMNDDVDWAGEERYKRRRLKKELLEVRNGKVAEAIAAHEAKKGKN